MAKTQKHLGQAGAAGRAVVVARGNGGRYPSSADSTVGDRCAPFNGSSSGGGAVVAYGHAMASRAACYASGMPSWSRVRAQSASCHVTENMHVTIA